MNVPTSIGSGLNSTEGNSPKEMLAQAGWFSDDEWAAAFEENAKTFREKVNQHNIPKATWGNTTFVHKDDILDFLKSAMKPLSHTDDRIRPNESTPSSFQGSMDLTRCLVAAVEVLAAAADSMKKQAPVVSPEDLDALACAMLSDQDPRRINRSVIAERLNISRRTLGRLPRFAQKVEEIRRWQA